MTSDREGGRAYADPYHPERYSDPRNPRRYADPYTGEDVLEGALAERQPGHDDDGVAWITAVPSGDQPPRWRCVIDVTEAKPTGDRDAVHTTRAANSALAKYKPAQLFQWNFERSTFDQVNELDAVSPAYRFPDRQPGSESLGRRG